MANADRPTGFKPLGMQSAARKYTSGAKVVPGEFVQLDNTGRVVAATAGSTILGLATSLAKVAGEEILVIDSPQQEYVGQASGAEIDAQTDIGNLCDILATAEDATYNVSRMEVDSSTIGVVSGQLIILDVQERPDNALGAQADVIVRINEHQTRPTVFAGI